MACTPDVLRLCGAQIPDHDRIVSLFTAKYNAAQPTLPRSVRTNSASSQQGAPQAAPRGRPMQPRHGAQQPYQRYQPYRDDDDDDNE